MSASGIAVSTTVAPRRRLLTQAQTGMLWRALLMAIYVLITVFPFYWMFITAFKTNSNLYNLANNPLWFNEPPTLGHIEYLFARTLFGRWMLIQAGILDQGIQWLGTPVPAMAAVIFVSTWRAVPFGAITVLAGLTAIPTEVIEAARIDGAGWWARFRYVIVPIIAPILFIALLFDLIFTLTELTVVFVLTGGGPVDQTQVLANYALQVGVSGGQLGQGAAIALYLLPVLLILTVLSLRHIGRREGL